MTEQPGERSDTTGGRLPPTAWMVRSLGRWIESRPFPSALRDRDDPGTVSRAALVGVFLMAVAAVVSVLFLTPTGSDVRVALALVAAALWTAKVATTDADAMWHRTLGSAPAAAGAWLVGIVVLETLLRGWTGGGPGVLVLQSCLAAAMAVVAWGKARLATHEG